MPRKDPEAKKEYQREWYANNRKRVIAQVQARKKRLYRGVCRHCGGPTQGSWAGDIPEWCSKPKCASAQRRLHYDNQVEAIRRSTQKGR